MSDPKQELLRNLPSVTELLKSQTVAGWLQQQPLPLVTGCLRRASAGLRQQILEDASGRCGTQPVTMEAVLRRAGALLQEAVEPRVRAAINATGIILHTGLGRAVFPGCVVDAMTPELKGYVNLAVDRDSGERIERDELVESLLTELTGAEAATVVNNNAGATMLALAALTAQREVIVSRGQLIEIGGSFRLPDVMAQSQSRLIEVGTTNRTHLKDYQNAITERTGALLRVHPSNYRVVGFTHEVKLAELAELAHSRSVLLMDDLGAGALLDLQQFGLPHEPTVRESIEAGADVVLFSADKLIGASQGGIIVGRKEAIAKIRKHPLMRALRVDKTCIMVLERTLHLFRDPERLRREHPTYRMMITPLDVLQNRARDLAQAIREKSPQSKIDVRQSQAFLGSGSLPEEAIPSFVVSVCLPDMDAAELARKLRLDQACIFGRIEAEQVLLDVRTMTDLQAPMVAEALGRVASSPPSGDR
ncbi:MAG: L-seryl-tRNA(Sec) selenium transferase [Verrucomicrobia bacterium]|nr:L-seryl-tRNA(Sec) selenium transferase [Verrucomicrobiota bacterium]